MKQSESIKKCDLENVDSAKVYFNIGITSDTKEDKIISYNKAIRIYKKCDLENEDSARAYFNLGFASDIKEEKIYTTIKKQSKSIINVILIMYLLLQHIIIWELLVIQRKKK